MEPIVLSLFLSLSLSLSLFLSLLARLILLITQLPLLIAKPPPAFMADMAMVVPYAQYVAEGFILLITTVHRFRFGCMRIKTGTHCCGHVPRLGIVRDHVVTAVIFYSHTDNPITSIPNHEINKIELRDKEMFR